MTAPDSAASSSLSVNPARWAVSGHVAAILAQLGLAVMVLAGYPRALEIHRANAWAVAALGGLVALTALGPARSWLGPRFVATAVALPLMEASQIWLGRHAMTPWHATLGILIWAGALALLIKVWRPDASGPPTTAA